MAARTNNLLILPRLCPQFGREVASDSSSFRTPTSILCSSQMVGGAGDVHVVSIRRVRRIGYIARPSDLYQTRSSSKESVIDIELTTATTASSRVVPTSNMHHRLVF
ncbi:hypothetical protein OPV22_023068 [Ensete ventricosum]|uniref:Uncharacterized protein n=1 Tax=Ensete ventricosum TaxID=4639 RepID=A0AAV8PEU1_ENSVE|nr:hypothetical protein OPV22_023068 [Ensete ventricosum]